MKWQELRVTTNECMLDAVTNLFYEVGAGGVVIEDPKVLARYLEEERWDLYELPTELLQAENVVVKGYLPVDEKLSIRMQEFKRKLLDLEEYFDDYYGELSTSQIHEDEWTDSWKKYYKPRKIGSRVVVVPSWENYLSRGNEVLIYLNPGMAFGTGTHPTTEMCVRALEKYISCGDIVYDVGTGSGILAIAAAKLGAKYVLARDCDYLAVKIASDNVALNHVSQIVTVEQGDLLEGVSSPARIITANIVAEVIMSLAESAFNLLQREGILIASGIISGKNNEVERALEKTGFKILETVKESGWITLVAVRK